MLREVKPPISARSLIQAHREKLKYYIERTWFSDLTESEEAEASEIFLGIGAALKEVIDDRSRSAQRDPGDPPPTGGLLNHLSKLGSDREGVGDDSLAFYEAAERLKAAIDRKVAATSDRVAGKSTFGDVIG